jgi:type I restriction enzyme R subunit
MSSIAESHVEEAALEWLAGFGYAVLHGLDVLADDPTPDRVSHDQVVLTAEPRVAFERLREDLSIEAGDRLQPKLMSGGIRPREVEEAVEAVA